MENIYNNPPYEIGDLYIIKTDSVRIYKKDIPVSLYLHKGDWLIVTRFFGSFTIVLTKYGLCYLYDIAMLDLLYRKQLTKISQTTKGTNA